jgi:hypothetical protein
VVDFDRGTLAHSAGIDPWNLLRQLKSGDPAQIEGLAAAVYAAGGRMADASPATQRSQGYVKDGYQVQGAAPLDFSAEAAETKQNIAGGADKLPAIAKVLSAVAGDLDAATKQAAGDVSPIVSLATPFVNQLFNDATDPGDAPVAKLPTSEAQLNDTNNESYQLHRDYLITAAAQQAGVHLKGSFLDSSNNLLPYNRLGADGQTNQITDLGNAVYNLEHDYGADRQSFDTPYQAQVDGQYWDDRGPVGDVDKSGWRTGDTARAMLYGDQNWKIISNNPLVDLDHEWPDDANALYELPR